MPTSPHIVNSAPAADRVGEAMRLLPMILLRHDPRVQRVYAAWVARAVGYEERGQMTEAAGIAHLFASSVELNALVRALKLQCYQTWLPAALLWEFSRCLEGAPKVDVTVPEGLPWPTSGKRPKRQPGAMGGYRLEDIEQHIERFYACEVQGVSKKRLAREHGCSRADVQHSIKRAQSLLACID
jgi:hypothetical protein